MSRFVTELFFYIMNVILFSDMVMGLMLILRPRWKHKWLPFVSYILYFSALYHFSYSGNGLVSAGMMGGIVITSLVFYKGPIGERLLLPSLFLIVSIILDYFVVSMNTLMGFQFETHQDQIPASMTILIIYTAFILLFVKFWNKFRNNNTNIEISSFAIYPLTQVISTVFITYYALYMKYGYTQYMYEKVFWIVVLALASLYLISDIFLFRAIRQNALNIQLKEQIKLLESKNAWEIEHNKMILNKESEIARLRHDFINVIQVLKLEAADTVPNSKSDKMLADLESELEKTRSERICPNSFINIILLERKSLAENMNIDFEAEVNIGEYESITNLDLSRIFINIIDNALDAASQATCTAGRYVHISAGEINGYIVIKASNTYDGIIHRHGDSFGSRKKSAAHGLGISIIRSIAEKYSGELLIDYTDSVFTITVTLLI